MSSDVLFGEVACAVCEDRRAAWLHHLDGVRSHLRVYGKGHVWGSPAALCETCDEAVASGEVDVLVSRDPLSRRLSGNDLDEQVRNGYAALVVATVRRESLTEATPPGWQDALAAGFTPIEQITGAVHLVHGWPEQHRRSIPAQDADDHLPDGRHWFIRSPWPSVDLEPLWHLVIHTIEVDPGNPEGSFTTDALRSEVAMVRELTALDEAAVQQRIRRLPRL